MDCILLAAGNSTRFGENKLLYPVNGKPMVLHAMQIVYQLLENHILDHLFVVTQYEQILHEVAQHFPKAVSIYNDSPDLGISHSIQLGLLAVCEQSVQSEGCLFLVGDQPMIKQDSISGLIEAFHQSEFGIAACSCDGVIGNPVIFANRYYPQLHELTGDRGGKKIVHQYLQDTLLYEVSKEELEDIDVKAKLDL